MSLGCSLFARRILRESLLLSFPPGTKMFQFPGYLPCLAIARHAIFNFRFSIFK